LGLCLCSVVTEAGGGAGGGLAPMIAVASKVKLGFRFIADSLKEVGGQWRRMNTVSR
jgi:glycerate kinase